MKADLRRIKTLEMAKRNAQIKADRRGEDFYVLPTKTKNVFVVDSKVGLDGVNYEFGDAVFVAKPEGVTDVS